MVAVGDKVGYIPDVVHALERDLNGDYPWVLGLRHTRLAPSGAGWQSTEEVEILEGKRLEDVLLGIRRHPNTAEEKKKLVFVRPQKVWPAVVTAVHEDGTVNLDICGTHSAITLHYERIPLDPTRTQPHSCFVA